MTLSVCVMLLLSVFYRLQLLKVLIGGKSALWVPERSISLREKIQE